MLDRVYLNNTRSSKKRYNRINKTHVFLGNQVLWYKSSRPEVFCKKGDFGDYF